MIYFDKLSTIGDQKIQTDRHKEIRVIDISLD